MFRLNQEPIYLKVKLFYTLNVYQSNIYALVRGDLIWWTKTIRIIVHKHTHFVYLIPGFEMDQFGIICSLLMSQHLFLVIT